MNDLTIFLLGMCTMGLGMTLIVGLFPKFFRPVSDRQVEVAAKALYEAFAKRNDVPLDLYPWRTRSSKVKYRFLREARQVLEAARSAL